MKPKSTGDNIVDALLLTVDLSCWITIGCIWGDGILSAYNKSFTRFIIYLLAVPVAFFVSAIMKRLNSNDEGLE